METQDTWVDARELFTALSDHPGPDAFPAVVEPWLRRAEAEYRELFTRLGMTPCEQTAAFDPFLHEIVGSWCAGRTTWPRCRSGPSAGRKRTSPSSGLCPEPGGIEQYRREPEIRRSIVSACPSPN